MLGSRIKILTLPLPKFLALWSCVLLPTFKFVSGFQGVNNGVNCSAQFPVNLSGMECMGLHLVTKTPMGSPIKTEEDCASTCCTLTTCDTYNFCGGSASSCHASAGGGCWIGTLGSKPSCHAVSGWIGGGGRRGPPPPAPTPPGTPRLIKLVESQPATPIPYTLGPNVDPQGNTFSVDSLGFLINGKRWYPVSGEIHLARVPASQWKEQLLRMKAGGLDSIAVYIFWIHHEEVEKQFNFTGRRNIRGFIEAAKDVGLKILLRVGPWDHGECRNGGHPDWLLAKSTIEGFDLRKNDSSYMKYVQLWYQQLSVQTKGMYFKDGGPIYAVQVDNETPDWGYLLSLKEIGISVGIDPPTYTKTGWPPPSAGYPSNYPMLPYFGGYADQFWSNSMQPNPNVNGYQFGNSHDHPAGYPLLLVELGGGMAADYNHRVHMDSPDMPAMHLVSVANGANSLGYYMYHGGNNPHSIQSVPVPDSPDTTLQESAYQPAGAKNGMPSFSYDFFAPLGEFGQPRQHFHQMRRLHLMVSSFELAPLATALPAVEELGATDLRYAARSDGKSGFLFVNNYQRLETMPRQPQIRFELELTSGGNLTIPAYLPPFDIQPGTWFVWPFNQQIVGQAGESCSLVSATAQLVTTLSVNNGTTMVMLAESAGIDVEIAFSADVHLLPAGEAVSIARVGNLQVVHAIMPSNNVSFYVLNRDGSKFAFVIISHTQHDSVWKARVAGAEHIFLGDPKDGLTLLTEDSQIHFRGNSTSYRLLVAPPFNSVDVASDSPLGKVTGITKQGVFSQISVIVGQLDLPTVSWAKTAEAGPPRNVPTLQNGKAREPNSSEWAEASSYTISLSNKIPQSNVDIRIGINYHGDSARVYLTDRCLTDNWFSGYATDGKLEVGFDYLLGENPSIFSSNLTLMTLPLKKSTLQSNVFLQEVLWPDFGSASFVNMVESIVVIPTYKVSLDVT